MNQRTPNTKASRGQNTDPHNSGAMLPRLFEYDGDQVRTDFKDGQVLFVASDVCKILGIKNVGDALARLDDDEKDDIGTTDAVHRRIRVKAVTEAGLYALIFQSRKPEAKAFKRWVTHEVIPAIRQTGTYSLRPPEHPMLALLISESPRSWNSFFPKEFYDELSRLSGQGWDPETNRRPRNWGQLTDDLFYSRLPVGMAERIREMNPYTECGSRVRKNHQHVSENEGMAVMCMTMNVVLGAMKSANTLDDARAILDQFYPRQRPVIGDPDQLTLMKVEVTTTFSFGLPN